MTYKLRTDNNEQREPEHRPIFQIRHFGCDLTELARKGKLRPVVGREPIIKNMIDTICCPEKSNPVLVGPAGVGKTAIVEGFARMVVEGQVPPMLSGVIVFMLQPSMVVAGCSHFGDLEERMENIINEASQDGVILFIDEVHSIIGAGGLPGTTDMASMLKPVLARSDIRCIAATTDDEYRLIERDPALERRFHKIPVCEMDTAQTFSVLCTLRESWKIDVTDKVLHSLVNYADKFMRNRNFPDKAVDILNRCVGHVRANGSSEITAAEANEVAQSMIGMPLDISARLQVMSDQLSECTTLPQDSISALINRMELTMRGLDVRHARPNAIMLLADAAAELALSAAKCISLALFDTPTQVVRIDMSSLSNPEHITQLLGARPGFVGYSASLPIHRIKQFPWSIVLFENVDLCSYYFRQILAQALHNGFFTDGEGKKIFISDAIVLLTAPGLKVNTTRKVGFHDQQGKTTENTISVLRDQLCPELVNEIDLVVTECNQFNLCHVHSKTLLGLLDKYSRDLDKNLVCDQLMHDWIATTSAGVTHEEWVKMLEGKFEAMIAGYYHGNLHEADTLYVRYTSGRLVLEPDGISPAE